MDPRYQSLRSEVEQYFTPEHRSDEPVEVRLSPSGAFVLEVSSYHTRPGAWDYSRGVVRRARDGRIVADVKRNHGSFWHAWVSRGDGSEYLLCGEDYQGYSIINLRSGVQHRYFPEEAYNGTGFCWVAAYPSPDGRTVAVDGCYWACPYELVLYDFTEPETLPLRELDRISDLRACKGWTPEGDFVFERHYEVRASDEARLDSLPSEEVNRLLRDPNAIVGKSEISIWRRP
jgi:hypothetical protein